ncbi:MAG: hypothetical protein ACREEM_53235 [Blastocatellia bacterium]
MEFLKRLFSRANQSQDDAVTVRVNMADGAHPGEVEGFRDTVRDLTGMEYFKGSIKHGYSLEHAGGSDRCPRCDAPTRRQYADFIYLTQIAPRVLVAPAGYFCTKCPTAVIDEKMIRDGRTPGFEFKGILGIQHDEDHADLLKTWNGKPPVFLLSGDEEFLFGPSSSGSYQRSEKDKRKRKMARESRKRNRRR